MSNAPTPDLINPSVDLAQHLKYLMADAGSVHESAGTYRIAVHHTRLFPWHEVFKALLYRNFRVGVTNQKADLFIEASPA